MNFNSERRIFAMKSMLRYAGIAVFLSVAGLLLQYKVFTQQSTALEGRSNSEEGKKSPSLLQSMIEQARKEERAEIILPSVNETLTGVSSMEEVIREYSLLRVKVSDIETVYSETDADIRTWYKLEVAETLCRQNKIDDQPLPENVPVRFLPLLPSESLLVVLGGRVTINGIRVILIRVLNEFQFELRRNKEYLIAAYLDFGGKLIRPVAAIDGVFDISDSTLIPLAPKDRELVREMEQIYGNGLSRLRSGIRLQSNRGGAFNPALPTTHSRHSDFQAQPVRQDSLSTCSPDRW
jgi:hypothetical protein